MTHKFIKKSGHVDYVTVLSRVVTNFLWSRICDHTKKWIGDQRFGDPLFSDPQFGDQFLNFKFFGDPLFGDPLFSDHIFGDPIIGDPLLVNFWFLKLYLIIINPRNNKKRQDNEEC